MRFGRFRPFAKQKAGAPVVDVACDWTGRWVAAVTVGTLLTFRERKLLATIAHEGNRMVHVSEDGSRVVLVAFDGLHCYDLWGNPKWTYATGQDIHDVALQPDGTGTLVAEGERLLLLDSQGEVRWSAAMDGFVGGVALAGDRCLAGLERSVRCLDRDGKRLWELRTGQLVRGIVADERYVACSSGKRIYCLTADGNLLWREEVGPLRHLRLVRDGGALLVATDSGTWCFETNGQQLWEVAEEQFVEAAAAVPTGELTVIVTGGEVFGRWELKLLDREGLVLESYSSREEISCLALPEHGGEVVVGIGSRVCWFRNSEFLKRTLTDQLAQVRKLSQKVAAYGPAPPGVEDSLEQVEARVRGSFEAMQEAYGELKACRQALAASQQQHVEYLNQLPRLMKELGLPESQPQELAVQLYPLYALYRRLGTIPRQQERRISEQLARLKKVAKTFGEQEGGEALQRKLAYTSEALQLLPRERRKLRGLMKEQRAAQKQVEKRLRQAVMDWMTSGSVGALEEFIAQVEQQQAQRAEGEAEIRERVRNAMAFAEMSRRFDHLELSRHAFAADGDGVTLALQLHNHSDVQLDGVALQLKLEGSGLELEQHGSTPLAPGRLASGERFSLVYRFRPAGRDPTQAVLAARYRDQDGQACTADLGTFEASLLGCYLVPHPLSEQEHTDLRAEHREQSAHSELAIDRVALDKAEAVLDATPGLAPCHRRSENGGSISYLAGRSNLADTVYLAMVVLKPHGDAGIELELLCRASQGDAAQELLEELQATLRNQLLEAGGRLA